MKGKIEFRNVWFRYPTRKQDFVLKGLNLTVLEGQSVALVGESGCGKSTFVNLLMRFYEVNSGDILVDGISTKRMSRDYVHELFGMVLQDTWLFKGTIKDNLIYGRRNATMEEIIEASTIFGLFIIKLRPIFPPILCPYKTTGRLGN